MKEHRIPKTVFLYLDAFRHEYLKHAPFISNLYDTGLSGPLKVSPLHQFEFTIFSGIDIGRHDQWVWFKYGPETSPFRFIRPFSGLLTKIDAHERARHVLRTAVSYGGAFLNYYRGRTRFLKIAAIPFDKAHLFGVTAKKSFIDRNPMKVSMLFDILRKKGIRYFCSEWPLQSSHEGIKLRPLPKKDASVMNMLKRKSRKYDFLFAHLWTLDSLMHRYGIEAPQVSDHIRLLDNEVKSIVEYFRKRFPDFNLIVSSDHGMVPVRKTVDVMKAVKDAGLQEGKHFTAFPGSIMVRFWLLPQDEESQRKILGKLIAALENVSGGRVYDKNNYDELGVAYRRDLCGDVLFMGDTGTLVSPNYFDGDKVSKAMHGYLPVSNELDGLFILKTSELKTRQTIKGLNLVDIMPTILDALRLQVPSDCDGCSIIREAMKNKSKAA